MAKQFSGADKAKEAARFESGAKLPAGAYICSILGAKYIENQNGDRIEVQFDISDGQYKGFFQNQYKADSREDKKYKGRATIWYPKDDGSERDEWTKNTFMKWVNAIEDSNEGYSWDWNEKAWKNKAIGLVFREVGNVIDGKNIKYTEVSAPISVQKATDGTFWQGYLKFKAKNGYTETSDNKPRSASDDGFIEVSSDDMEELPFA